MNRGRLIAASLRYYRRTHLGVALGAAVGTAVLLGALLVGDSMRGTLREMALRRVGKVTVALGGGDRFFRAAMAEALGSRAAAVLAARGLARNVARPLTANQVQVFGVDHRFWRLSPTYSPPPVLLDGEVAINDRLARQLDAAVGDTIILRVDKPSLLPRDMPLASHEDASAALRLTVKAIVDDGQFGRFSLRADTIAPCNAYLPRDHLATRLDLPEQANLLLATDLDRAAANEAFEQQWSLADAQLTIAPTPDGLNLELRSGRVFLDEPVERLALSLTPRRAAFFTYFVNGLHHGEHATPYSTVAATDGPLADGLADDEVRITQWLADDLGANPGDTLTLRYFVLTSGNRLTEQEQTFRVRDVIAVDHPQLDAGLMPDFPGLAQAENCRDWEPGIPIDFSRIRPKDEVYWDDHRGTPKAVVTLAAGRRMWANRFGSLTAVRYPAGEVDVAAAILPQLKPRDLGLQFVDVRGAALAASDQSLDFGQLFLGMSFFLMVAAITLTALLFAFSIEQRAGQIGTLLALGLPPRWVRRTLLLEGLALALIGAGVGAIGGVLYTHGVLWSLRALWTPAVAGTPIEFHARPMTLLIGALGGVAMAAMTMAVMLRRHSHRSARELLSGVTRWKLVDPRKAKRFGVAGAALILCAATIPWLVKTSPTAFFGMGSLLLLAGITLCAWLLTWMNRQREQVTLSLNQLGMRNSSRRRGRSLATIVLLACGTFLLIAVGANRKTHDAKPQTAFTHLGQMALPLFDFSQLPDDVDSVPLRVREGDDASCLNLNRAQMPRLLGVDPRSLDQRLAFDLGGRWEAMLRSGDHTVHAIGDEATVVWGLRRKVGDIISYTDERGETFHLRIAATMPNSILQGSLLIAEHDFERLFPSESGYRWLLIDTPPDRAEAAVAALRQVLADHGLELTGRAERLAMFNAVENAYLAIFQALGALGLLLGSVGVALVVLRNLLERRSELALLCAVGLTRRRLRRLVVSEHALLVLLGLITGGGAAMAAVWPALSAGGDVPWRSIAWTMAAIALSGLLWAWLAAWAALRGPLLGALRSE